MIETQEKPLITFALFAYNQEKYIREAVEGAFAQNYSPLEIILSDDCSSDRTFEIIQEMVAAYKGPHKIILNRNTRNLGLAGHVNIVMGMAQGELVVFAAGDDISLPQRTMELTRRWLADSQPSGICSWTLGIDQSGNQTSSNTLWLVEMAKELDKSESKNLPLWDPESFPLLGCSAAWAKDNWNFFGPLNLNVVHEDNILTFRAALRGGVAIIPRPLVHYRQHDSNIWNKARTSMEIIVTSPKHYLEHEQARTMNANRAAARQKNYLDDLQKAEVSGVIALDLVKNIRLRLLREYHRYDIQANWWKYTPLVRALHWTAFYNDHLLVRLLSLLPLKLYAHSRFVLAYFRARFY